MTYCLGTLIEEGLILMADTRTNAGVDNFSSYRKLHTLAENDERQIYACTSGSLSVTQAVLGILAEGLEPKAEGDPPRTLQTVPTMFRAAQLVGETVQVARRDMRAALAANNVSSTISFLLGGRIGNSPPKLYLVYTAGNFIECKTESPFYQIGETKYGKPILDRALTTKTSLAEAVKLGFLSFDSAIRSNLGVARPIDVVVMPTDRERTIVKRRVEETDPYFDDLSVRWQELLVEARTSIPDPPWMTGSSA